jgi:D-isomer specific 2-hydroxyacid dehydrogenase, NAD binding domain
VLALTLSYPNVAAVGYPLLHGPASGVADAAGLTIGSITVVPVTLAILENRTGNRNPNARAGDGSVVHSIVKALEKAVVWAPVLGIVFALFSIYLAKRLELSLATMGSATTGGALFLTGLVVSAQAFRLDRVVILSVLGKNIIQPAFCLLLATAIGMEPHQRDYVDTKFAALRGIIVSGTGSGSEPPAELTWALILGLARSIVSANEPFRNGGPWQSSIGADLFGKQLGLLGLGKIGSRVARVGLAFGMKVVAWSQNLTDEQVLAVGVERARSKRSRF